MSLESILCDLEKELCLVMQLPIPPEIYENDEIIAMVENAKQEVDSLLKTIKEDRGCTNIAEAALSTISKAREIRKVIESQGKETSVID